MSLQYSSLNLQRTSVMWNCLLRSDIFDNIYNLVLRFFIGLIFKAKLELKENNNFLMKEPRSPQNSILNLNIVHPSSMFMLL